MLMRETFSRIYELNLWGSGSGEGSLPVHTQGYVQFLQNYIKNNNIRSVVDLGCGDWQFSKLIDWTDVEYTGFDIVPSVIEKNRRDFSSSNIDFHLFDGDYSNLPIADLLIVKDVLQHWPDKEVLNFLPELERYRQSLITNCVNPIRKTAHGDTDIGGFRQLDLRIAPYNLKARHVYSFRNAESRWWKPES